MKCICQDFRTFQEMGWEEYSRKTMEVTEAVQYKSWRHPDYGPSVMMCRRCGKEWSTRVRVWWPVSLGWRWPFVVRGDGRRRGLGPLWGRGCYEVRGKRFGQQRFGTTYKLGPLIVRFGR
jgi:hypothetical protein